MDRHVLWIIILLRISINKGRIQRTNKIKESNNNFLFLLETEKKIFYTGILFPFFEKDTTLQIDKIVSAQEEFFNWNAKLCSSLQNVFAKQKYILNLYKKNIWIKWTEAL